MPQKGTSLLSLILFSRSSHSRFPWLSLAFWKDSLSNSLGLTLSRGGGVPDGDRQETLFVAVEKTKNTRWTLEGRFYTCEHVSKMTVEDQSFPC